MAVAVAGTPTNVLNIGAGSTVSNPAGLADGEALVLFCNFTGAAPSLNVVGFTQIGIQLGVAGQFSGVWAGYRLVTTASGETSTHVVDQSVNAAQMVRLTGVEFTDPLAGTPVKNGSAGTSAPNAGTGTPDVDDAFAMAATAWWNPGTSHAAPTGMTQLANSASNGGDEITTAYEQLVGGNGVGISRPWVSSAGWASILFFMNPASVTPVAPPAPTTLAGSSAPGRVPLSWVSGGTGGSAITSTDVDWALASAPTSWLGPDNISPASAYTKTGLTNGTGYVFRVRNNNAIGPGTWSSTSSTVTPSPHPVVKSSNSEVGTALGTANAQVLPTGAAAGDLVLYFIGEDNPGATAITVSTGWTLLSAQTQGSNVITANIAARVLDGTTGNNILSVSGTASQDYVVLGVCIAAGDHGVTTVATDMPTTGAVSSTNGNADPPLPTYGTSKDWLVLAAAVVDLTTGNTITAAPTNYDMVQNQVSASSTTSVATAVASRRVTTSTENPGTFTNTSRPWIAYTLAVPPASGAAPSVVPQSFWFAA